MNQFQHKFNVYDQLAYILVGLYTLGVAWVLYVLIFSAEPSSLINFLKIEFTIGLILCAYLVGHLVQAASNAFEWWEKKKKEEKHVDLAFITAKAREFFSLPKELPDKFVWQYCYLYALSNDFSGHVALFNSLYSLYRGFWIATLIGMFVSLVIFLQQVVVSIINKFSIWPDWRLFVFALFAFLSAMLFSKRKERFFNYMNEKTLITYDILVKNLIDKK